MPLSVAFLSSLNPPYTYVDELVQYIAKMRLIV